MNLIVCIKQVPDPLYFDRITLDPVTKLVKREGVPLIMNPNDLNAVETALQIKDTYGGKITVLTMGPPQSMEVLEEALALGADEAILLSDRAFAGADAVATSYTLASAIKKFCEFDLILCGYETVDSGTRQVGPQLAEYLDIPHVTGVRSFKIENPEYLIAERRLENGYMKIEVTLPALIAVYNEANDPRIPTVSGIMNMASKSLKTYGLNEVGLISADVGLAGSPTQMAEMSEFKQNRRHEVFQGIPEEIVKQAIARLKELQAI